MSFLRQSFTEFKAETASAFRELWKKEGEQDARLNTVERKHEGLEREHNVLTKEHRVLHVGEIALTVIPPTNGKGGRGLPKTSIARALSLPLC